MNDLRAIQRNPRLASANLARPTAPNGALEMLRRRLLDPGLDAQGILSLADAILALQRSENLQGRP